MECKYSSLTVVYSCCVVFVYDWVNSQRAYSLESNDEAELTVLSIVYIEITKSTIMALPVQICPRCQSPNGCSADAACWCHSLPPIVPATANQCYCNSCLLSAVKKQADDMVAVKDYKAIAALGPVTHPIESLDYTINDAGNLVFTAWYHLRRGTCCGSGCLHCPYEWENVRRCTI